MPTYEYACRACGEHVEVVQSFKDEPLTSCGLCGGELRKVFSAAGIIFKGSGYYVTDNRKKAASEDGGSKTDTAAKTDSSSKASETSSKASDSASSGAAAKSA